MFMVFIIKKGGIPHWGICHLLSLKMNFILRKNYLFVLSIKWLQDQSLPMCHNKRISRNRVFKGLAARGKTTMGWFYGLKLHLVINHKGSIVAVKITPGNVDERSVLDEMTRNLKGTLFADKGFISQDIFKKLFQRGLKLITGIRKNMKNYLMPLIEKILLRKRFLIETI